MKNILLILMLFSALSVAAQDNDNSGDSGFFISVGAFDGSGTTFDFGYDINSIVAVEAKYSKAENKGIFGTNNNKLSTIAINLSHDFNTESFNLYAKLGYTKVNTAYTQISISSGYFGNVFGSNATYATGIVALVLHLVLAYDICLIVEFFLRRRR